MSVAPSSRLLLLGAMVSTIVTASFATGVRPAAGGWVDDFSGGISPARWSYPLNNSCWRMDKGVTFEDSRLVYPRHPTGITFQLDPYNHPCEDRHGEHSLAIGTQLQGPCTISNNIFGIHMRAPTVHSGALMFYSIFKETHQCTMQLLFGYKSNDPNHLVISMNGKTFEGHTFKYDKKCTLESGFNPADIHSYSMHYTNTSITWVVDGFQVDHHDEPFIGHTCDCVAPYLILRSDGDPITERIEWLVDEVFVQPMAAIDPSTPTKQLPAHPMIRC